MDKQQADKFIGLIAGSYPSFELTKDRVKIWRMMLEEIDLQTAMERLKRHLATSIYPPTIAEILNPKSVQKSVTDSNDDYVLFVYDPDKH